MLNTLKLSEAEALTSSDLSRAQPREAETLNSDRLASGKHKAIAYHNKSHNVGGTFYDSNTKAPSQDYSPVGTVCHRGSERLLFHYLK